MNKFQDIFNDLEQKILDNEYKPNSLLPSEHQLMEIYDVSRETVRKALAMLINVGYIQKKQGKGSIVLDTHKLNFPVSGLTSYQELQQSQNINSQTIVVHLEEIEVSSQMAELTMWPVGAPAWEVIRQRKINDEVVILDKDILLKEIVPVLPFEKAEDSLYRYFENELDLKISYAQKEITVDQITVEDKHYMDLQKDTHVVAIRSLVYLEDTRCFEYTESRHRLEKFKFNDFARRRPN